MIHSVKATPNYFEDVVSGRKPFEVRLDDREYEVGDYLALNEWSKKTLYSGGAALFQITYVLRDPQYCKKGFVILGIVPCKITAQADFYSDCSKPNIYSGIPVYTRPTVDEWGE